MSNSKNFVIALDGGSGTGKSTTAKIVAKTLGITYLDTGAMYRALGLYMLRRGAVNDVSAIRASLDGVDIAVEFVDGAQHILLDGEDVTLAIREPEVSMAASAVSAVPEVRERMVALQRMIVEGHHVIMDGRDIGTKVLPNATLKVYMTAAAGERARRRCLELAQKGMPEPYEKVLRDIEDRDYQDIHRAASPLRPADDAVTVDTTGKTFEESVAEIKRLALEAIGRR